MIFSHNQTPAEVLEPHRKRRISTLLARLPDDAAPEIVALFDLVYAEHTNCDHATARVVHDELESTRRTVGDLIDGWRPRSLRLSPSEAGPISSTNKSTLVPGLASDLAGERT